ncbi:hypothetical protein AB0L57_28690 [Nocardia sp. NPDC052254]|uniref:hypothetical protein n=1 Tax=Nocardia sp. NPDC052254 TaxID=3155681 RepID=UPI0034366416
MSADIAVFEETGQLAVLDIDVVAPLRIESSTLLALVPEVLVDGMLVARGWGHWAVPVPPGRHDVGIHINRFGALLHPARLTVDTAAGARTPVHYRMPVGSFASARIGTTPQRAGGGGALVAVILFLVGVIPLGLVTFMVLALLLI